MAEYNAIANTNQGIFNNPRQKMWATMKLDNGGWSISLITNCFDEAKEKARQTLNIGGQYMSIDRIMVVEIVPIDTVMTPFV